MKIFIKFSNETTLFTHNNFVVKNNIIYINSLIYNRYAFELNFIQLVDDKSETEQMQVSIYGQQPLNSSEKDIFLFLLKMCTTSSVKIFENKAYSTYIFHSDIEINLDKNYTSPTLYCTLTPIEI